MFHVDNNNSARDNHSEEMDLDQSLNSEEDPNPSLANNNDSHSAVTDADMLCLISTNERFLERFLSWIVFDNFGFGEREILDKKPQSRSKVRFRPG